MTKIKEIPSLLIDAKERIHKLEDNTNEDSLKLYLFDLKCFWKLSKIDSISLEKYLMNHILNYDKNALDFKLSLIKSNLKTYLNYYSKNSNKLDILNKKAIVKSNLFWEKQQYNLAYDELLIASKKYESINNEIEGTAYLTDKSSTETNNLIRLEKHAKKEYKELLEDCRNKFSYHESKYLEYSTYTCFKFKDINDQLSKCIDLIDSIQNKKYIPTNDSTNIVSYELVGITYRLSSEYFKIEMNEKRLGELLNLRENNEEKIIQNGYTEKFLLIIRAIYQILESDNKDQWENSILKLFKLNKNTYLKGNLGGGDKKKINEAFSHLKKV